MVVDGDGKRYGYMIDKKGLCWLPIFGQGVGPLLGAELGKKGPVKDDPNQMFCDATKLLSKLFEAYQEIDAEMVDQIGETDRMVEKEQKRQYSEIFRSCEKKRRRVMSDCLATLTTEMKWKMEGRNKFKSFGGKLSIIPGEEMVGHLLDEGVQELVSSRGAHHLRVLLVHKRCATEAAG